MMLFEIDTELAEVIRTSWFTLDPDTYAYTKVEEVRHPEKHLIVTRDADEITVVTALQHLELLGRYERNPENWRLMNIKCGNPFYCVGFLASICSEFARNRIDVTATSTYTNDYIMVQEGDLNRSLALLVTLGFEHREQR
ncbi:ACT domain-containing protein [Pontibacter sp. G13]|uniref:ACT domain-containing protein n=1 Tax=Pontibacter sp. G13 TaxID=3074898 RepID=UPI00288B5DE1|nr:ACT domain-containing protein [Pontibacter sp. G13]WNJ18792.1 ACT domain-containing protein [Pontibacter sp. G13]